jgi:hypothetical protein
MATDWLRYANQGATRNQPLSPELVQALGGVLPDLGLQMEVFSGGQPAKGSGGARVGSVRHDHGGSADVFFHQNGRKLDWANPQDQPIFQDLVRRAKAAGVTGFGAGPGYMQPGSMHIGFGKPGVWGAGGSGKNAPSWLVEAYNGAAAGAAPAMASAAPTPSAPAAPTGVASMFAESPLQAQAMALMPGGSPAGPAMPGGTATEPAGMLLGNLASAFIQNTKDRQQQRQDEQAAEEIRRAALLGGGGGIASLYS